MRLLPVPPLLPDDLVGALPIAELSANEMTVMNALVALLDLADADVMTAFDLPAGVSLRVVAQQCGWSVGARLQSTLYLLRDRGFVAWTPKRARTIRLTSDGWRALGRLTPLERVWRNGFSTGRAAQATEDDARLAFPTQSSAFSASHHV